MLHVTLITTTDHYALILSEAQQSTVMRRGTLSELPERNPAEHLVGSLMLTGEVPYRAFHVHGPYPDLRELVEETQVGQVLTNTQKEAINPERYPLQEEQGSAGERYMTPNDDLNFVQIIFSHENTQW